MQHLESELDRVNTHLSEVLNQKQNDTAFLQELKKKSESGEDSSKYDLMENLLKEKNKNCLIDME
jgi:hypothetical protein